MLCRWENSTGRFEESQFFLQVQTIQELAGLFDTEEGGTKDLRDVRNYSTNKSSQFPDDLKLQQQLCENVRTT